MRQMAVSCGSGQSDVPVRPSGVTQPFILSNIHGTRLVFRLNILEIMKLGADGELRKPQGGTAP
jgi:hypothetical protein